MLLQLEAERVMTSALQGGPLLRQARRRERSGGPAMLRSLQITSLRARLVMAVILTTLPLMAVIWYDAQREFERESLALEQEVQRLTAFITGSVNHLMEETRQVLIAVNAINRATPPEMSKSILANLAEQALHTIGSHRQMTPAHVLAGHE